MSSKQSPDREDTIRCPVCRARQTPQATCRRCRADLDLFLKAVASRSEAGRRLAEAEQSGDAVTAESLRGYLQWLGGSTLAD